ncbi:hypothetical protein Tco_1383466 [Tanacetum coccineum]
MSRESMILPVCSVGKEEYASSSNRSIVLSVSSPNEPKSSVFPPNAIQMLNTLKGTINHNEVDIDNMTLEEYARYEVAMSSKKDEKDSNLDEILGDLFRIGAENIRKMEHEVPHRYDDKTIDITDYEDSDHEDGELPDLLIFSATNEFASVCKQVKENIDINIAEEKEEVPMKDVEMDETTLIIQTIPSSISNEVYAFGISLSCSYSDDKEVACADGCCSRKKTWSIA